MKDYPIRQSCRILRNWREMIKGAIFDMDGTLIDSMFIFADMPREMLAEQGIVAPPDINARLRRLSLKQMAEYCRAEFGVKQSADEIIRQIVERVYSFYVNEVEAKPGIPELLARLKAQGTVMCVITASERAVAEAALKRTGLLDYFKGIITCSEFGSGKSQPDIYRAGLELLGTDLSNTIVFEDEIHAIETLKADGFTVCGVAEKCVPEQDRVRELADHYFDPDDETTWKGIV